MNEQQHDMTGAWALNALDDDERALLEEFLAQDPDTASEARSFEETAGELARGLEPETPRPELKRSLMAQISQTPQLTPEQAEDADPEITDPEIPEAGGTTEAAHEAPEPHPGVIPLDRYRSRTRWLAVAAAGLMVTSIAGFGLWGTERAVQQENRETIEAMESAQAEAEEERQLVSTILASDDASHLTIPYPEGGDLNLMYSRAQQAMIVQAAGLPELPASNTYQLWLIDPNDPDNGIESAGVLAEPGGTVMVQQEMTEEAVLALTVEPAGGSEQPTMSPIADGAL